MKLSYITTNCLIDTSNGASKSITSILEALGSLGVDRSFCCCSVFDAQQGEDSFRKHVPKSDIPTKVSAKLKGMDGEILNCVNTRRYDLNGNEVGAFHQIAVEHALREKPDFVISFSGLYSERFLRAKLRSLGIKIVFYIANGSYNDAESFENTDLILTNSGATAKLYKDRLGLELFNPGLFIDQSATRASKRNPEYIAMVNPTPAKGVHIFIELAKLAKKYNSNLKFLIVEGRAPWFDVVRELGYTTEDVSNIEAVHHQRDMKKFYAKVKVLIVPSRWHESSARVIVEANGNGIPVICSDSGGMPEVLGGGGIVVPLRQELKSDWNARPTECDMKPWLSALQQIATNDNYPEWEKLARANADRHCIKASANRLYEKLNSLM